MVVYDFESRYVRNGDIVAVRVPVSDYRANLRAWHARVAAGEEVIVTEHGVPTVRVVVADASATLRRLEQEGLVRPARARRPAASIDPVRPSPGDVGQQMSEDRR
jgi:prevent-host-death family protein